MNRPSHEYLLTLNSLNGPELAVKEALKSWEIIMPFFYKIRLILLKLKSLKQGVNIHEYSPIDIVVRWLPGSGPCTNFWGIECW